MLKFLYTQKVCKNVHKERRQFMKEQRRAERYPVKLVLEVSEIFKQNNVKVVNINAPIEVFDVSQEGVGFYSKSVLPIGYYFNARLELGEHGDALNCVVQIIRSQENGDEGFKYGCTIIGAASIMNYVFEDLK